MLLQDNRISMRIQKQILKNAKRRTKDLFKKRNASVSLSVTHNVKFSNKEENKNPRLT